MNQEDMGKWKETVMECHKVTEKVATVMANQSSDMIDHIRNLCESNRLDVDTIQADDDNGVFTVELVDAKDEIQFSMDFIQNINMAFCVKRRLTRKAEHQLYIELYPLGE